MTFLFDLDDTLLNTKELKRLIFSAMEQSGLEMREITRTYEECIKNDLYSPEKHIKLIRETIYSVDVPFIMNILAGINYKDLLIPTAQEILMDAKKLGKTILLTKGDYSFQAKKIIKCGISDWFDDVIITTLPKEKAILEIKTDDKVYVFNDKNSENEEMKKVQSDWIYINVSDITKDWAKIKSELA